VLISTTAMPWSTLLITSSTRSRCTTPGAAVGSSMNTTLLGHTTELATATLWRWPPDSEPIGT
jgi:hypothetical protein